MSDQVASSTSLPPGELLRNRRIQLNKSVEDIARGLYLSSAKIRALEEGNSEALEGEVYIVGYWRSYARLVELDLDHAIRQYRKEKADLEQVRMFRSYEPIDVDDKRDRSLVKSTAGMLALVLIAIGLFWYGLDHETGSGIQSATLSGMPGQDGGDSEIGLGQTISRPGGNGSLGLESVAGGALEPNFPKDSPVSENGLGGSGESRVSDIPLPEDSGETLPSVSQDWLAARTADTDDSSSAAAVDGDAPGDSQDSFRSLAGSADSGNPADPAGALIETLVVRALERGWIDIRTLNGEKLVYRVVDRGETLVLEGVPPFAVFLEAYWNATIEYRGEAVEAGPYEEGAAYARFLVGDYPETG
ncbi:MAG: helix-turn-helix domain-containing protein [Gammaproteobacteria bacterium]|nr:helix-turn-helix domain-containing protein [Gammaproteobacteria bacterium]